MLYYRQALNESARREDLAKEQLKPDLHLDLFHGINAGPNTRSYVGVQAGVGIPLWRKSQKATIAATAMEQDILALEASNEEKILAAKYLQLATDLQRYQDGLDYYRQNGQRLAAALIDQGDKAFKNGEIDFLQYVQLLEQAKSLELNDLDNRYRYNQTVIEMDYLLND